MSPLLTIDVAHPPRHPDIVERELSEELSKVKNSASLCVLKIIHGHGSTGKGGSTKEVVRNWAFRNRQRVKAIINGEDYTLFSGDVQKMRSDVGNYTDTDLEQGNPGILIVWVK